MYKTTVKIEGMMCEMCEAHVNDAIRNAIPGAGKVKSSHRKGESRFVSETIPREEILREAIEKNGYTVGSVNTEPYRKKLLGLF